MSNTIGSQIPRELPELLQTTRDTGGKASDFGDVFTSAIREINTLQADADGKIAGLLGGNEGDVHSAMIAVEKADISFQLLMQVRNKIVNAYQEISRMQF